MEMIGVWEESQGSGWKPSVCRGCSSVLCTCRGTDRGKDAQGGCLVHLKAVGAQDGELQGWGRESPALPWLCPSLLACLLPTCDSSSDK